MGHNVPPTSSGRKYRWGGIALALLCSITVLLVGLFVIPRLLTRSTQSGHHRAATPTPSPATTSAISTAAKPIPPPSSFSFIASIDTMKASRDTQHRPLSSNEIRDIVNLSASLNTNYITVDTNWDYPDYIQQWVDAVRAAHRRVWFRAHPDKWESSDGMTPTEYEKVEQAFILQHPSLFQAGDIFDPCSEPEQGHYWIATYNTGWTYDGNTPNDGTREFNAFIRDTSDIADAAFKQKGISGVDTSIHSTNVYILLHILEQATVDKFKHVTLDSYPEDTTTDPASAVHARLSELATVENRWQVPVIIGEMGYSNKAPVDDVTQQSVLKAELAAIAQLSYVTGVNYWVGAGSVTSGGYTYILTKSGQTWTMRPAANELAAFYKAKLAQG